MKENVKLNSKEKKKIKDEKEALIGEHLLKLYQLGVTEVSHITEKYIKYKTARSQYDFMSTGAILNDERKLVTTYGTFRYPLEKSKSN